MTRSPKAPFLTGIVATFLQSAAVGATWLTLVTLATGCFFAPRGAEAQPTTDDVIGFGFSMAIAAAAAAIAAFAIGGWRRWAIQLSLSVLLVGTVTASLLISITGMIFGAIAGAVVAGLAMYATRSAGEPHASQPSVGATLVRR